MLVRGPPVTYSLEICEFMTVPIVTVTLNKPDDDDDDDDGCS